MTVYIEYVILDNLIIDYLLLKTTYIITGKKYKKWVLFLTAILGAGLSLVTPLIENIKWLSIPVKILIGLLLIVISNRYTHAPELYVNALLFIFLTFAVGGAIMGIFLIFGLDYGSELSIAFMIVPVYVIVKSVAVVIKYIYRKKSVMQNVCEVEVSVGTVTQKLSGFVDTGNALYFQNYPVCVCEKGVAVKFFNDVNTHKKTVKVDVRTVSGLSRLIGIKVDSVIIYYQGEKKTFNEVVLAVSDKGIGSGYDLILHPDLLDKGEQNHEDNGQAKKVS